VLYEAKGSNSREDIRMALGQILDYSRYVKTPEHEDEPRRAILLPSAPAPDMYTLLDRYDVEVVYRSDDGHFVGSVVP
jgi:5-methylcytosine-specific restriction protein A